MKLRLLFAIALLIAAPSVAKAQAWATGPFVVSSCGAQSWTAGQSQPMLVTTTGLLCTNASISGSVTATTAATAASTLPTISAGSGPVYQSLGGSQYVQPVFGSASGGGTIVTTTAGLPVAQQTSAVWSVTGSGTAGTAASGVLTVQGIASMTPLLVTASAGTNLNTSALALEAGNLATVVTNTTRLAQASTTSGQTGSLVLGAVTASAPSYTTGQTNPLSLDQQGSLRVSPSSNASANIAQYGGTNVVNGGLAGTVGVGGVTATNVAITDNPLNVGAQAVSSENSAVTTARKVQLVADLVGKLIVLPYANPENFVSGVITTAMTGTTSTSLVAAPASGLRNYITNIVCSNAHATVGTDIIVQDGSGGTTIYSLPAAAVYGGASVTFPTPLRQPTTATALFVANVTTGASTKCAASGYKGA